jgi:hypothetical protein
MSQTSTDEIGSGILGLIVMGLIIWGGSSLYQNFVNKPLVEVSGIVKFDDCREKITLNNSEYTKQSGTFICNDIKTDSGKSMGGQCVKTITDDSGKCQTAYLYEKPPEATCIANAYLTKDDKCSCNYGYIYKGDSCISYTQDCQNSFGTNSYGVADNTGNSSSCYCNSGYFWNSDKTSCISQNDLNKECTTSYGEGSYSTTENGKHVCDCSYGYAWNTKRDSCVTIESINQICVRDVGINSYYLGNVVNGKYNCK